MSEPTDDEIVQTMIDLGGSFVSRLGEAWRYADASNRAILRVAFDGYWENYKELAALKPPKEAQ